MILNNFFIEPLVRQEGEKIIKLGYDESDKHIKKFMKHSEKDIT